MEQRTDEWYQARLGKVTASRIGDVMAKAGSATRDNYQAQLIAERLTGRPTEGFTSSAMQWGVDNEAGARAAYSFITGMDVAEVGFVDHDTIAFAGASPDGLVGTDGLVEIKCPNTATHLRFLADQKIDKRYMYQMFWQMECTGREWCDFASYDPRLPPNMALKTQRVMRDAKQTEAIRKAVTAFLDDAEDKITTLVSEYGN